MNKNYEILYIPGIINAPIIKLYEKDTLFREWYVVMHKKTGLIAFYDKVSDKIHKDSKGRKCTVYDYCKAVLKHFTGLRHYMSIDSETGQFEVISEDAYLIDMLCKYVPDFKFYGHQGMQTNYFPTSYLDCSLYKTINDTNASTITKISYKYNNKYS